MSKTQAETAVPHADCYALVGINMAEYYPEDGNRQTPPNLEAIIDRILVIETIGIDIKPLIKTTLEIESLDEEIHLGPDYSVIIPQAFFKKKGKSFEQFCEYLIAHLKQKITNPTK